MAAALSSQPSAPNALLGLLTTHLLPWGQQPSKGFLRRHLDTDVQMLPSSGTRRPVGETMNANLL